MRLLYISRKTLFDQAGGDTLHLEQHAHFLRKLGHDVEIATSYDPQKLHQVDLLHFFNLGRPADLLPWLKHALPLVVSSIFVQYQLPDGDRSSGLKAQLSRKLDSDALEYLKTLGRGVRQMDRFPPIDYLLQGQHKSIQRVLDHCSHLITASQFEWKMLEDQFRLPNANATLPLGHEHAQIGQAKKRPLSVLCVGRFEPLKNQLNLIRAQKIGGWPLSFIGDAGKGHEDYYRQCRSEASEQVCFAPSMEATELAQAYAEHRVLVVPSYFETTSLVSIEGLKNNCHLVCTDTGAMGELYGDVAIHCQVDDPESIAVAVNRALKAEDRDYRSWVEKKFSWERAAEQLEDIYKQAIHAHRDLRH